MAKLIIKRPFQWKEPIHSYKIYVDEKRIGKIYAEETKEFDISPGQHIIKAKYRIFSSKPVNVEVKNDDETIQMQVYNNQQLWEIIPVSLVVMILVGYISKFLPQDDGFISLVAFGLIIFLVVWLHYKITPYLKLEQVDENKKILKRDIYPVK